MLSIGVRLENGNYPTLQTCHDSGPHIRVQVKESDFPVSAKTPARAGQIGKELRTNLFDGMRRS